MKNAINLLTYIILGISLSITLLLVLGTGSAANAMVTLYWIVVSAKLALEAYEKEKETK